MAPGAEKGKPPESRRAHKKSRTGCLICKQRRVKCDEVRPQCGKCAISGRTCSYATSGSPGSSGTTGPRAPDHNGFVSLDVSGLTSRLAAQAGLGLGLSLPGPGAARPPGHFTAFHMALFFHASTDHRALLLAPDYSQLFISKALESAQDAPYLLEQLLALAALHLATTNPDAAAVLRQQATELQTRALGMFNACTDHPDDNLEANFLFTAIVGMQVLGETFANHMGSIGEFLAAFIEYTRIHRGVRAVISTRWQDLLDSDLGPMLHCSENIGNRHFDGISGLETSQLRLQLETLASQNAPSPVGAVSLEALRWTQNLIEFTKDTTTGADGGVNTTMATMAWPMLMSEEYIESLYQHRPEALCVMAFYGALVHQDRHFWLFADYGATLVRMVVAHLGPFWADALAWPVQVISRTDAAELPVSREGTSVSTPLSS